MLCLLRGEWLRNDGRAGLLHRHLIAPLDVRMCRVVNARGWCAAVTREGVECVGEEGQRVAAMAHPLC